jgi:hypothetical protein
MYALTDRNAIWSIRILFSFTDALAMGHENENWNQKN